MRKFSRGNHQVLSIIHPIIISTLALMTSAREWRKSRLCVATSEDEAASSQGSYVQQ
ncbi:hypothetical protein CEP54_014211, partial [Fusarium duplospermum]